MSLSSIIKEFAQEIGFDVVGISPAVSLTDTKAIMDDRIDRGLMAGMNWFTHERAVKCCNPRMLLPSAASVISFGVVYAAETAREQRDCALAMGRVARYALVEDYHKAMMTKLRAVAAFIARQAGGSIDARLFVDAGPLAEREFARRSGVGWFGKNGSIITREYGSWVLLGEIVASLELEHDAALAKSCGQCRRCIEACPTGAIIAPYTLDANLCISYLTIEHKGLIPRELRPLMGDWVFGCDRCQEVCPANRKATIPDRTFLQPINGRASHLSLREVLAMDEAQFAESFKGSAIRRAKLTGLQRNAAIALGNRGESGDVPYLLRLLESSDALVRAHAAWALGRIGGRMARKGLELHRSKETDSLVRDELEIGLGV